MAAIFAFKCRCCGEIHEGSPSFAYGEPSPYVSLTAEQKDTCAKIDSDLCAIKWPDRTDYFVRAVLEVPIQGVEEPFTWGIWSSLSEKSFKRYVETYDDPVAGETFFGWVSNRIPGYPDPDKTFSVDVVVQAGGARPKLLLHPREDVAEHPLVIDQQNGISVAQAQKLAEELMHGVTIAESKSGDKS